MGGSSSQVVGYRYYAKFAAFIGNRIEKLLAINFDNRGWIVKDRNDENPYLEITKPSLYGENEGGVAGIIDIEVGTPDQEPNETYQKYFPLVSGYPYQSYLVFRERTSTNPLTGKQTTAPGFYLGNSGYMKEMLLWVKRTRVRNDGREQWYEVRDDGAVVCEIEARINDYADQEQVPELIQYSCGIGAAFSESEISFSNFDREWLSNTALNAAYDRYQTTGVATAGIINPSVESTVKTSVFIKYAGIVSSEIQITSISKDFSYQVTGVDVLSNIHSSKSTDVDGIEVVTNKILLKFIAGKELLLTAKAKGAFEINAENRENSINLNYFRLLSVEADTIGQTSAYDINPIHKIREILTDDTAMGKPEADVNDVNFTKAADRIFDESLGISWAIDEKSCIDAIEELCYHIEAGVRVNRQTGLYEMVLFRDDWFEESEIHTITENRIKDLSLEVMNSDDIVNQLNVTYYDRERIKNSTFSIYENGSILTMGHANAESVEFPYFMNMRNAEVVANWKLKQFATPAWSGSFSTGWREARKWNRYDLIRLPWSKKWNGTILARIMKINLGDGVNNTVTIDFEEVIPYSGEMNTSIVVDAPIESAPQPPQPSANAIFEAPYYLTVLRAGQTNTDLELSNNPDIGYVAAIAAKPQSNSLNALLYTDGGVDEFEQVSRLDYCDILQLDQPINETMSAFVVTGSLTQPANSNNFILLNDELMGFVSFNTETQVLTVKRGVLDTVPKKHSSGSLFVFDLPDVAFDATQYAQSEVIEAQVLTTTPSGIQEISASGTPVEIQSRAIRPYPPANVKINGEYWPENVNGTAVVIWADRNRLQQTGGEILGWFDNSVSVEHGVTYHYETINASDTVLSSGDNVASGVVLDVSDFYPRATLKLWSKRDGYDCMSPVEILLVSAIGELAQFIEPIYAKGEAVKLSASLSNNVEIVSLLVVSGSLPTGWILSGNSITGKATTNGSYTFTISVTDVYANEIQKTFSVLIQGQAWAQLTFDSQNMMDQVSGNTWVQGSGNTFVAGHDDGYALKMGGIAAAMLTKSMTQTTSFTMSCRIKLTKLATDYIPILYLGDSNSNSNRDCIYIIPVNGENILRSYRQAGTGTSAAFNAPDSLPMNEWVRIAYEINGVSQRLFINDELVASGMYSATISSFTAAYIGLVRSGNNPLYRDGVDIDDVLITTGANRFS